MITIDVNAPVGLSEQIRQGIRQALANGALQSGQALPPVRQLAADLGVNFNTVARAYRTLEEEGLVRSARGRGTVVVASRQTLRNPLWQNQWQEHLRQLAADAKLAGLDRAQFQSACRQAAEAIWSNSR